MLTLLHQEPVNSDTFRIFRRRCVVCRRGGDKRAFLRFFKDPSGSLAFDPAFRMGGYGIYVCPRRRCVTKLKDKVRGVKVDPDELLNEAVKALEQRLQNKITGGITSRSVLFMADGKGRVYPYFRSIKVLREVGFIKFKLEQLCSRS